MFTPQFPAADPEQGLFWFWSRFEGRNLIGHDGGDYGASTDMSLDPATGAGAIILMNVDDSPANFRALQRIKSMLFEIGEGL